jgi:membrane protease YdiL (CAAX protease family)
MTSILSPYRERWPKGRPRQPLYSGTELDCQLGALPVGIQFLLVVVIMPVVEETIFRAPILMMPADMQVGAAVVLGIAFLAAHLMLAFGGQLGAFITAVPYLTLITFITSMMVIHQGAAGIKNAILLHAGLNALMVVEFWCQRTMQRSLIASVFGTLRAIVALSEKDPLKKK